MQLYTVVVLIKGQDPVASCSYSHRKTKASNPVDDLQPCIFNLASCWLNGWWSRVAVNSHQTLCCLRGPDGHGEDKQSVLGSYAFLPTGKDRRTERKAERKIERKRREREREKEE